MWSDCPCLGCGWVVMFQSFQLCVQPTGSTNAETLHSGIWAPPIARKASTQTLAHICIVTASQETWSSLPAEPSTQPASNSRWSFYFVSSSLSVQHRVRGCAKKKPTSTSTSATICIKTSFTIVQGCSTSSTNNDGESIVEHLMTIEAITLRRHDGGSLSSSTSESNTASETTEQA